MVSLQTCKHTLFWERLINTQTPLSMRFSRQEYRMDCRFLLQGTFLTQGPNQVSYVSCIGRHVSLQLLPPGIPNKYTNLCWINCKVSCIHRNIKLMSVSIKNRQLTTYYDSRDYSLCMGPDIHFPGVLMVKNPAASARATGRCRLDPWSGKSPGEENGNPLQYSCLGNPMKRRAGQATFHSVAKSQTRLSTSTMFDIQRNKGQITLS